MTLIGELPQTEETRGCYWHAIYNDDGKRELYVRTPVARFEIGDVDRHFGVEIEFKVYFGLDDCLHLFNVDDAVQDGIDEFAAIPY